MGFLKLLESIRNPFFDGFFSLITYFGDEVLFIVIGLLFYWCIDKKKGYYILSVGLLGTVINQFLKLVFRIPRPWVQDPEFKIVESAREAATGYSFPSGHTQSSVGMFSSILLGAKKNWLKIVCIVLMILVPFSRLYLGVHTPLDVGVSFIIALILAFGLYPVFEKGNKNTIRILFGLMILFDIAFLVYVHTYNFPSDIDATNLTGGIENGYKMLGCIIGLWCAYETDNKFTKFETKAPIYIQILKFVLGLIPVILIKTFLKTPLNALIGNEFIADGIRYLLICLFAGTLWPMTFKYFNKIFCKKHLNN